MVCSNSGARLVSPQVFVRSAGRGRGPRFVAGPAGPARPIPFPLRDAAAAAPNALTARPRLRGRGSAAQARGGCGEAAHRRCPHLPPAGKVTVRPGCQSSAGAAATTPARPAASRALPGAGGCRALLPFE